MAVRHEEVQDLMSLAPDGFLVTSFYLNVDAAEFPSPDLMETSFDSLIHTAEDKRKDIEDDLSHEARESIRVDLEKIREFFTDFQRDDSNSVAVFSCSAMDFWEVIQMPTPVDSMVSFNETAYVAPLAAFFSHNKPTAILLTDRQHARIFTMSGGEVREWTDFESFVPHRSQQGGWSQNRYQRRSDQWSKHHIDHAAELVLRLLQHYNFDWLILGVEVEAEYDLKSGLHPYVKDTIIGEIHVRIDAPASEVIEQAREVREEAESRLIDHLIGQVEEYAGAGGRATIGLADTIQALNEQKIHILLVQDRFRVPGARCSNCGMLYAEPVETCTACGEPAEVVENVVDDVIQRSFELGSTVEVATEMDKLEPIQCIGSVMYY